MKWARLLEKPHRKPGKWHIAWPSYNGLWCYTACNRLYMAKNVEALDRMPRAGEFCEKCRKEEEKP